MDYLSKCDTCGDYTHKEIEKTKHLPKPDFLNFTQLTKIINHQSENIQVCYNLRVIISTYLGFKTYKQVKEALTTNNHCIGVWDNESKCWRSAVICLELLPTLPPQSIMVRFVTGRHIQLTYELTTLWLPEKTSKYKILKNFPINNISINNWHIFHYTIQDAKLWKLPTPKIINS